MEFGAVLAYIAELCEGRYRAILFLDGQFVVRGKEKILDNIIASVNDALPLSPMMPLFFLSRIS